MSLRIIGTSHIAKDSIQEIRKAFLEENPAIVAVELDVERAKGLMSTETRKINLRVILQVGWKGFLFATIGQFVQQKLGKMVGVSPGSEMKEAIKLAREKKATLALIDQPIGVTLKKFSQTLTWKEKFRFVGDFCLGIFNGKKQMKKFGLDQLDLRKVPSSELIEKMVSSLKFRYPNVYKSLVEDRNHYMVKQIIKLIRQHPDKQILVIVGAGHKRGMEELLLRVDVV